MKVIILSHTNYKENDLICNAISETDYFSFKAFRAQDNKTDSVWLNNVMTIADIELSDRRYKYPTLKEARMISCPLTKTDSLEYMFAIGALTEVANYLLQDDEKHFLFKDLEGAINALENDKDIHMVLLILLAKAISLAGAELEVNQCVFCGSIHEIVAFSFPDGGFVCRNCLDDSSAIANLTPNQMKLIRYAFKAPDYSCVGSDRFTKEDKIVILKCFKEYINDGLGANIKSIDNLLK